MFVVCLIEEDVFPIAPFCCPLLKNSVFANSVFGTETLPKDRTHLKIVSIKVFQPFIKHTLVAALSELHGNNFTRHLSRTQPTRVEFAHVTSSGSHYTCNVTFPVSGQQPSQSLRLSSLVRHHGCSGRVRSSTLTQGYEALGWLSTNLPENWHSMDVLKET